MDSMIRTLQYVDLNRVIFQHSDILYLLYYNIEYSRAVHMLEEPYISMSCPYIFGQRGMVKLKYPKRLFCFW